VRRTDRRPGPWGSGAGAPANPWTVLAVVLAGFFMILLDGTIANVAIPPIQQDLAASYSAAQWMMGGYAMAYGLLLIPAGRIGDRFGAKRLFLAGLVLFTASSLLCGIAGSAGQLVFGRVSQGAGGGLMNPAILAMIQVAFPAAQRGRAFVWYGATAGVATAIGPVLGGVLVAADVNGWGWRPIFVLNLPIGVALLAVAARVLPEHRGRGGSLDPVGTALLTLALLLFMYPLVQGYEQGWPVWVLVALVATVPALALFLGWQVRRLRQGRSPLIDVRLFRSRSFAAGVGVTLCQFVAFASLQFVLSVHLQLGLGASAAAAGLALMPFALGAFLGSSLSNMALVRFGRRALHCGGGLLAVGTAGVVLMLRLAGTRVDAAWLAVPTFVAGVGAMMLGAPLLHIVQSEVPGDDAGSAGGIIATAQRTGHALGIATVGTTLFALLPPGAREAAPGALAREYATATQVAVVGCLAFAVLTFLLVFLLPELAGRPGSTPARVAQNPGFTPSTASGEPT
jgi:EmrB/QacA subfamily drug resistance transporter